MTVQLPREQGGGESKVAYIDTEGTFKPDRIRVIAARFGLDPVPCLEDTSYVRALYPEHQHEIVEQLGLYLSEGAYKVIIVDSIISEWIIPAGVS